MGKRNTINMSINEQVAPPTSVQPGHSTFTVPAGLTPGQPDFGNAARPPRRVRRPMQRTPVQQLDVSFPDNGLTYGLKKNAYVQQLQKKFGFQPAYQTGNYLDMTKSAVKNWLATHHINNVPQDGSVITYQMYLDIFNVDENGQQKMPVPPPGESTAPQNPAAASQPAPQSTPQQSNTQGYNKSRIEFPIYMGQGDPKDGYDPSTWGRYITALQSALQVPTTGILDQATFDAVKRFIADPKKQALMTEPVDSDSKNVLNNQAKPGITAQLYNTIMRTNDQIIIHNRQHTNPDDIINEMTRMKFKLKRFFK
jgi:hypothetical protein